MKRVTAERILGNPLYVMIGVFMALVIIGSIASPDQATALPLPGPADLLNGSKIIPGGLDPTQWPVEGFKAIVSWIVGDVDELGKNIVNLLLAVPILSDEHKFPKLNQYREYMNGGAWGLLGLSFVVASLRYWLSGYTGGGSYEALTGFARSVGAICMLLIFVPFFDQLARMINAFTAAIIVNPLVGNGLGKGFVSTISTDGIAGGGVGMIIALGAITLAIVLLVVKVIIIALLAVMFVASPFAIALWPIEELSWFLRSLLQATLALMMFTVIWALCFGTFAVLNLDALFPGDHGNVLDKILAPLLVLSALIVAFKLPFAVTRMAMQAGMAPGITRGARNVETIVKMVPSGRFAKPSPRMKS